MDEHSTRTAHGADRAELPEQQLAAAVSDLSQARDLDRVLEIVRHSSRRLVGADGATIVMREGDLCHYVDEDAIGPLWKGRRFPIDVCISGWVMKHGTPVAIDDVATDARIPHDVYEPTFVKSLAMVPIRVDDPLAAIGAYWAHPHRATAQELGNLEALASATAVTLESIEMMRNFEARVAERTVELETANLALEHFASVVSHDLRSPLANAHGAIESLAYRLDASLSVQDKDLLDNAAKQMGRLVETVEALLRLARLTSARLDLEMVSLNRLVDDVVEGLRADIDANGASIVVAAMPKVYSDRVLLRILLQNLLANAVKFRHPSRRVTVRVDASIADTTWSLTVTDNGLGLDPRDTEHIFELFGRTAEGHKVDGSGIGLATCRRIAERLGGTIQAQPREDGATFIVELPLSKQPGT